jgi:hypothetical protein
MGFLDKLLRRTKGTGESADKAAPMVEKPQDAAGQTWDKAQDRGGDAKGAASDARDAGSGSGPPAA